MPLFCFHLRLPTGMEHDLVGVSFASAEEGFLQACQTIPTIARELLQEGHDLTGCGYLITDAAGQTLFDVPFSELNRPSVGRIVPPAPQSSATSPYRWRIESSSPLSEYSLRRIKRWRELRRSAQATVALSRATVEQSRLLIARSKHRIASRGNRNPVVSPTRPAGNRD